MWGHVLMYGCECYNTLKAGRPRGKSDDHLQVLHVCGPHCYAVGVTYQTRSAMTTISFRCVIIMLSGRGPPPHRLLYCQAHCYPRVLWHHGRLRGMPSRCMSPAGTHTHMHMRTPMHAQPHPHTCTHKVSLYLLSFLCTPPLSLLALNLYSLAFWGWMHALNQSYVCLSVCVGGKGVRAGIDACKHACLWCVCVCAWVCVRGCVCVLAYLPAGREGRTDCLVLPGLGLRT
jgi:hypothetical protein